MSDLSRRRLRALIGVLALLLALGLAAWAIRADRHEIAAGLRQMPIGLLIASHALGLGSVVVTLPMWRAMLGGLDVHLPFGASAQVFFVGQLGKYLPGAVWPVLAQMELARRFNVARARMFAGGVLTVVLNVAVGGALASALVPFVSTAALRRFWWLPVCVPIIVFGLQPKLVSRLIDRLLRLVRRPPLEAELTVGAELRTGAWGLLSWLLLGAHVYLLADGLGRPGWQVFAASVAAASLAVSAGTLSPLPAGVGVREVAFVLTLGTVLPSATALLVALLSRAILVVVDVIVAAAAGAAARHGGAPRAQETAPAQ